MIYEFELPIKPFSINAAYYRTRSIKTAACREWEAAVKELLDEHKILHEMADNWKKTGGVFQIRLEFVHPHYVFFNKAGLISSKSFDLSNLEKLLIDVLFGQFMDVNDRNITKLTSVKYAGTTWCIKVKLELHPNV